MTAIDTPLLKRFIDLAGERLRGDWVVLGGSVLPLLGVTHRVTVDIDIAGPQDGGEDQADHVMEIADELGLPIEAINQAAAFFIHRIAGWEKHLVEIHRGSTATFHVPDATLFTLLKIGRLTETDLLDVFEILRHAREHGQAIDVGRVQQAIDAVRKRDISEGHRRRLERLLEALADTP